MKLSRQQKEYLVDEIQDYFEREGLEPIGNLQVENMLDFFVTIAGPYVYNEAVKDARTLITERMQAIEDELYTLEKPVK